MSEMPSQNQPEHTLSDEQRALLEVVEKIDEEALYARLDPGIRETVRILRENGIETTESCEGTPGHCYPEPTVCFQGAPAAGFHALAICMNHGLKVAYLQRVWNFNAGELTGPEWRLVFFHKDGGGLHPVERPDGKIQWVWGRPPPAC